MSSMIVCKPRPYVQSNKLEVNTSTFDEHNYYNTNTTLISFFLPMSLSNETHPFSLYQSIVSIPAQSTHMFGSSNGSSIRYYYIFISNLFESLFFTDVSSWTVSLAFSSGHIYR